MDNTFSYWRSVQADGPARVVDELRRRLASFPETVRKAALAEWCAGEVQFHAGGTEGALANLPFVVKDLFDIGGRITRASSRLLDEQGQPAERTAPFIELLQCQGAVAVGKTHLHEFAYGLSGRNPHFGDCPHPFYGDRLAGGSSSGSAWAVGAGLVPFSIGTDTAGSARVPGAYCGVYAIRTVPGAWNEGVFPLSPSFDTAGWFASSAADMMELLELLVPAGDRAPAAPLRVLSLIPEYTPYCAPEIVERARALAAQLEATEDAEATAGWNRAMENVIQTYSIISSAEAYEVHAAWLDVHREKYDPKVWPLIDRGRYWTEREKMAAAEDQRAVADVAGQLLESYDAIILPAAHTAAPKAEWLDSRFREDVLRLTTPASVAVLPALEVPFPLETGDHPLTGGLQIILPRDYRRTALAILAQLQAPA